MELRSNNYNRSSKTRAASVLTTDMSLLEKSNHCLPKQLCRMHTALQTTKSILTPFKAKNSILP